MFKFFKIFTCILNIKMKAVQSNKESQGSKRGITFNIWISKNTELQHEF